MTTRQQLKVLFFSSDLSDSAHSTRREETLYVYVAKYKVNFADVMQVVNTENSVLFNVKSEFYECLLFPAGIQNKT